MDLNAEKEYIKSELDKIEDIHLLEAIKNMLEFGKAKTYEEGLYPMGTRSFYERNALSRKAIEEEKLIDQEEARQFFMRKKHK